jgi:predicted P-loop ATPase
MLLDLKQLHKMGFALHWLKANSKQPLENGWTKGERKTWQELEDSYQYGLNIGVRLGKATRFKDGTYLAVIDCDVKSEDAHHLREMEKKLSELIDARTTPTVVSGRGNGSMHLYVRTSKPVRPYRYCQSAEKVRVLMPSAKPSRHEQTALKPHELKDGFRLRAAWEISIMGEGQQVVLPPSVHPDTGNAYEWREPFRVASAPLVSLEQTSSDAPAWEDDTKSGPFTLEEVDLLSCALPDSTIDLILSGEGCDDRSAALFTASIHMVKAGFTDNQILSVLTDKENYLGQTAYEHAHTTSRRRAAEWIRKYTLSKVKRELSAAAHFAEVAEVADLDEKAAQAQAVQILGKSGDDWKRGIERNGDHENARPKNTLKNVHMIIANEAGRDIFKRNAFAYIDHYTAKAPWGGRGGQELSDIDLVHIKFWLANHHRFEPPVGLILEAVQKIASENQYHPVRDYLSTLSWDGVDRLDNWLETYLGATGPRDYLEAVGRKTLCAMIARILEPGIKFDTVLVLEGRQGCGKSTAVKILSDPWFSDAMINIGDKDAVLAMRLAWVMELGELSSMRKADIDQLKQFISQPTDRIRVPYGRLTETFPRQSIFIGTTNSSEYLKDTTGNRRFWPVKVRQCDFEKLVRDRAQLLAEARVAYELGEHLYLDKHEETIAAQEQAARVFVDEWVGVLGVFLKSKKENFPRDKFSLWDLFSDFGPLADSKCDRPNQMRAAEALRLLGYEKSRARAGDDRQYFWTKPKKEP